MSQNEPIACIEYAANAIIITPLPDDLLDNSLINKFQETVFPLTEKEEANLVVDLAHVRSISSSALGCLLTLKKRVEQQHGRFIICCVTEKITNTPHDRFIYEIFKVTKLDSFFEICDNVQMAMEILQTS
jgi:anti-anti-sigma factor